MEITKLTPDLAGKKVICTIRGTNNIQAEIQYEMYDHEMRYFLCQNEEEGAVCNNQLGYKYSYILSVRNGIFIHKIKLVGDENIITNYEIY